MTPPAHLLVVDDDSRIRELLRKFLAINGFRVTLARDAARARRILSLFSFDMIVLDVMMPGEDGVALTQGVREAGLSTPVLLLTAKGETSDRISGFQAGADDYLPKPFEPQELLLRINAVLRRTAETAASEEKERTLRLGEVTYDIRRGEMWRGDEPVPLTGTEARLMRLFAENPGETLSRADLADDLGGSYGFDDIPERRRAVDVRVIRLRRKIEEDPGRPRYLQTVRGSGYMLAPD